MAITKFVTYPELPDYGVPRYSRKHLLDLQRRGQFPRALQLTPNRIGWDIDAIQHWVASRPPARSVREDDPSPSLRRGPRAGAEAAE